MRAPDFAALRQLPAAAIKAALTGGTMSVQGQGLSPADIDAVSQFLWCRPQTRQGVRQDKPCAGRCVCRPHWSGWGGDAAQHRFQPAAMAELAAEDVPKLKLAWVWRR
jgi:polyvinyl alcohol dehydrogenase (cytochrome)